MKKLIAALVASMFAVGAFAAEAAAPAADASAASAPAAKKQAKKIHKAKKVEVAASAASKYQLEEDGFFGGGNPGCELQGPRCDSAKCLIGRWRAVGPGRKE